jgi:Protein of unknown function (DUF2934)
LAFFSLETWFVAARIAKYEGERPVGKWRVRVKVAEQEQLRKIPTESEKSVDKNKADLQAQQPNPLQPSAPQNSAPRNEDPQNDDLPNKVRRRAYEIYEERGRVEGFEVEDWLQAESELLYKTGIRKAA